jgi:hypothetical protein
MLKLYYFAVLVVVCGLYYVARADDGVTYERYKGTIVTHDFDAGAIVLRTGAQGATVTITCDHATRFMVDEQRVTAADAAFAPGAVVGVIDQITSTPGAPRVALKVILLRYHNSPFKSSSHARTIRPK